MKDVRLHERVEAWQTILITNILFSRYFERDI